MQPLTNSGKRWRCEEGAFTIEASILFPILLIITMLLIFFSLVIYQKALLHQRASVIASQVAYVWDNSKKDIKTGEFGIKEYTTSAGGDGLYWRLTDDMFLSQFVNIFGNSSASVSIGGGGGGKGPEGKMGRASTDMLPSGAKGKISYKNSITGRKITVKLEQKLSLPSFVSKMLGGSLVEAEASSFISEPVEITRTTDLMLTYLDVLKKDAKKLLKFNKKSGKK